MTHCQEPDWTGCYDDSWGDMIVEGCPEILKSLFGTIPKEESAYTHPAKFARGLIQRIILHGLAEGLWQPGDLIGDPFGGVALGGIVAAYNGLRWVGVELEQTFVDLGNENIRLHRQKWENGDLPIPTLLQGDSRNFAAIVGQVSGIVTSPPYISGGHHPDQTGSWGGRLCDHEHKGLGSKESASYGSTPGQIGCLAPGDLDAVVTSPPFGEDHPCASQTRAKKDYHAFTRGDSTKRDHQQRTDGNIATLAAGDSYWQAMAQVYHQCLLALKPAGVLCVVVKAYVKNKKLVPLPDQTWNLLLHTGFLPLQRIRASLVKETSSQGLFGNEITTKKERKSFFRRTAETRAAAQLLWPTLSRREQYRNTKLAYAYCLGAQEDRNIPLQQKAVLSKAKIFALNRHKARHGPVSGPTDINFEHVLILRKP